MTQITDMTAYHAAACDEVLDGVKIEAVGGAYEGADKFDRSLTTWNPPMRSADANMLPIKDDVDTRVEDMLRNDAYVQSGQSLHRDNIVGSMYVLNSKPDVRYLGLDEEWAADYQEEVESKFMLAGESIKCWLDASRTNTLTSMVRLAIGVYAARGEFLATGEFIRAQDRPFKTAVQLIDLDRLRTPTRHTLDKRVHGGIRVDGHGAPLGAYIHKTHPRDFHRHMEMREAKYVPMYKPWGRPQVIHIKEQMRPDQTRGVSEMVAGLKELRITKKFRDITLQNAVVNATFAASIESELPSEAVYGQLGAGSGLGEATGQYGTEYLSAVAQYAGASNNLNLDGARIPHLFPGTKLKLHPAGNPGGVGQEFEQSLLRYIAATLGVSYEQLSRDYSKSNYSSSRAAGVETWKFMQSRKKLVADRLASTIFWLWLEEQISNNQIEALKFSKAPNFWEGLNGEAYTAGTWIGAARGQIDELKETQASVLMIKYGLSTHEDELAKKGKDWRKVFAQMEREQKEMDTRGIVLQEDNSINAASGAPREKENDGTGTVKDSDKD